MKIGIVSPYAYPRPGGANDNIRETYQNLRARGHEVRILTAPWGDDPPAQDVIQIGQAIAVPFNGSIGRITLSPRLEYLVTRVLDHEQFVIIRVYGRCSRRSPDRRLWVAGGGPQVGALRRYARQGRGAAVLFAGGVSENERPRFYKTADVFCAPSTGQESFGIVLLEAMAAGLPVVASDIHGYKRVVQRNVTGLLVEPKEPDAIAAALERLICDEGLRRRLGEAGARRAPEYDWSHVTRELLDLYGEVIAKRVAA